MFTNIFAAHPRSSPSLSYEYFDSDMGSDARKRLQLFAANFEQRMNSGGGNVGSTASAAAVSSSLQEAHGAAAERRGLLDGDGDDEDMIEFETRKKTE